MFRERSIRRWRTILEERVADGHVLTFERHRKEQEDSGETADFDIIGASDWVNIVAVTEEGGIVLIEQFRHGSEEIEVEIPGGIIDPEEDPEIAALRELREETGYAPGLRSAVRLIGIVRPNPAIMANRCYTYLLTGAVLSQETEQDALEEIRTRVVDPLEVLDMTRTGRISHALVISAFWWLHLDPESPFREKEIRDSTK